MGAREEAALAIQLYLVESLTEPQPVPASISKLGPSAIGPLVDAVVADLRVIPQGDYTLGESLQATTATLMAATNLLEAVVEPGRNESVVSQLLISAMKSPDAGNRAIAAIFSNLQGLPSGAATWAQLKLLLDDPVDNVRAAASLVARNRPDIEPHRALAARREIDSIVRKVSPVEYRAIEETLVAQGLATAGAVFLKADGSEQPAFALLVGAAMKAVLYSVATDR